MRSGPVRYFPIRHHSPACAVHVRRWIEEHRPASILIEGGLSYQPLIDALVDQRLECPVAIFTSFVDRGFKTWTEPPDSAKSRGPRRFAAFYPLCDYSPELVALRCGHETGARLRFIDLDFAEITLIRERARSSPALPEGMRIESLASDPHLMHSRYLEAIARAFACRDFNELWDHLFEGSIDALSTDDFLDRLATYCILARAEYSAEDLERDATTAREVCMAEAIADELKLNTQEKRSGPILVVTGGFHSVVLPDLVAGKVASGQWPVKTRKNLGLR
jgi:hypothetical protein